MKDYYAILGVPREATEQEIKNAYRKLVVQFHPDKDPEADRERFLEIQEAYETLRDARKRKAYNRKLERYEQQQKQRDLALELEPVSPFHREGFHVRVSPLFAELEPEGTRELHADVILTREEAESRGILPLDVPFPSRCPRCMGTGGSFFFPCEECDGSGMIQITRQISVRIPDQVRSGSVYSVHLDRAGFPGVRLYLYFHIR